MTTKAIFFDRDGVLNEVIDRGKGFSVAGKQVRWSAPFRFNEFRLKSGLTELLEKIKEVGYLRILVTNQPDIAYGMMTAEDHELIMAEIKKLPFDDIYV